MTGMVIIVYLIDKLRIINMLVLDINRKNNKIIVVNEKTKESIPLKFVCGTDQCITIESIFNGREEYRLLMLNEQFKLVKGLKSQFFFLGKRGMNFRIGFDFDNKLKIYRDRIFNKKKEI